MEIDKKNPLMEIEKKPLDESVGENHVDEDEELGTEEDDSEEDPTFDILEETRSGFLKLSLKKSKSRISKVIDSGSQEEPDDEEIKLPELDAKDLKSFENVEKLIAAGQLEKLKVEQCKVYLRKNGLRLTGNKDVLIERIREHLGIINGGGEHKYPVSSFVLNCKGCSENRDACTGDVVMFEQNVYEMYSIASRSATGPPCGTRIVAGRIVKESYGSAKQQHTFTIEVLWSKGVKLLPPLHPLLIKGRNLYRLKTVRQLWADEETRRKVLLEKHSRGSLARSNRETRVQEKEMRKIHKGQRVTRNETQEQKRQLQTDPFKTNITSPLTVQPQKQQKTIDPVICRNLTQFEQHKPAFPPYTVLTEICHQNNNSQPQPNVIKSEYSNILKPNSIRYQNSSITEQHHNGIRKDENHRSNGDHFANNMQNHFSGKAHQTHDAYASITEQHHNGIIREVVNHQSNGFHFANNTQSHLSGKVHQSHGAIANGSSFNAPPRSPAHGRAPMQRQVCEYYAKGRCYFGENCKYFHEDRQKSVNDERITANKSYPSGNESNFNSPSRNPTQRSFNSPPWSPNHGRAPMQLQVCRYYAQGNWCRYGENCKYLHERR